MTLVLSTALDSFMNALFKNIEHPFLEDFGCLIVYDPPPNSPVMKTSSFLNTPYPTLVHFPSTQASEVITESWFIRSFVYPETKRGFANPSSPNFNKQATQTAYTRTLQLLRDQLSLKYDLEKVKSYKIL